MANVSLKQTVNAPLAAVWASWDDFGNIAAFHPELKKSFLLEQGKTSGLGAMRQCDMKDGKNYIREKIVGYTPNTQMVIDIYEGTMPIKDAVGTLNFKALGDERTEVEMILEFTPKMGLIGKLMLPMMKKQFGKIVGGLLATNAKFVETSATAPAE